MLVCLLRKYIPQPGRNVPVHLPGEALEILFVPVKVHMGPVQPAWAIRNERP